MSPGTRTEETRSLMDEHAARQPVSGFSGWDIGAAGLPAVRPGIGRGTGPGFLVMTSARTMAPGVPRWRRRWGSPPAAWVVTACQVSIDRPPIPGSHAATTG